MWLLGGQYLALVRNDHLAWLLRVRVASRWSTSGSFSQRSSCMAVTGSVWLLGGQYLALFRKDCITWLLRGPCGYLVVNVWLSFARIVLHGCYGVHVAAGWSMSGSLSQGSYCMAVTGSMWLLGGLRLAVFCNDRLAWLLRGPSSLLGGLRLDLFCKDRIAWLLWGPSSY